MGGSSSKKSSKQKPTVPVTINLPPYLNSDILYPSTSSGNFNLPSQSSSIKNPQLKKLNRLSDDWTHKDYQNLPPYLNSDIVYPSTSSGNFNLPSQSSSIKNPQLKKLNKLSDDWTHQDYQNINTKSTFDQPSKQIKSLLKNSSVTTINYSPSLSGLHGQGKKETKDFYHQKPTKDERYESKYKGTQSTINSAKTLKTPVNSNWTKENSQAKQLKPMQIENLARIMTTSQPRVMTFILNNHSNGFIDLLKTNDMPFESLKLTVEAIQICCECSQCPFTRSAFLQTILYCDIFHTSLPQWLSQIEVESLNIVFNILSICNKLMLEFPQESARKLKKTLYSARCGLQRLNRKDTITKSCLEMIENLLKSSHEISRSSENLLDMSKSEKYIRDIEPSDICSMHTMMIEKEMNDIIGNQTENDYDFTKMQVTIVGLECDLSNGLQHVLKIIEIETIKGRVLLPGSIIALYPQEEWQKNHYLKAVITAVQLEYGTILIKLCDLNVILDSTTRYTLVEGPILYKVEYMSLLEALYWTQKSEIGFLEQLKPTERNIPSEEKTSFQIDNDLTNFDDNGVKAVITCPGENGVTFGINYISKKLLEKPVKPILVLCKTDVYLNTFIQELLSKNQNIICDGGTGAININNLTKWTLNQQQNFYLKNNFASQIQKQILEKMNRLKQDIVNEFKTLNANCQNILSADHLTQFMNQPQKNYFDAGNTIDNWLKPNLKHISLIHACGQKNTNHEIKYIFSKLFDEQLTQLELNRRVSENDNSRFMQSKYTGNTLNPPNKIDELQSLSQLHFLTEAKAANTNDQLIQSHPLNLNDDDRWQLYEFWVKLYNQTKLDRIQTLCAKYEKMYKQLEEIICEIKLLSINSSKIQVMVLTTVVAIKQHSLLKLLAADTVLIMEASNVPVVHILPFIYKNCESLIIVGNSLIHKPQLSGVKILDGTGIKQTTSILEQVLINVANVYVTPCTTGLHPFTYHYFLTMNWLSCSTKLIANKKIIKGTTWNIAILDHNQPDLLNENNYINPYEQKFIIGLCKFLINKGTNAAKITIVTLTTDQWISTTNLICKLELSIKCEMIVNLTNEKNDIIVLSGSPLNENIYNEYYISQLLSMANVGFILIAKFKILDFKRNNNMWEKMMFCAQNMGIVGKTGAILCQNEHKLEELTINANNINKIAKIIAGGCKKSSTITLSCGHTYLQKCISMQQHQNIKCMEKCLKTVCKEHNIICENLCGALCSTCINHQCKKKLPCGHICSKMANESCEITCSAPIDYNGSPCGHQFQIRCFEKSKSSMYLSMKCVAKCDIMKPCGHTCEGNCGKCFGGKMHIICTQRCQKTLVCGHICNNQCEIDCPPCNKIMAHECVHKAQRNYLCGTLNPVCTGRCYNTCPHYSCSKQCWEPCDFSPCNEPCLKVLSCGHQCIGLCSDVCPKYCRTCHPSVFKEDPQSTNRYVYLEDCGHLIDVNMMDNIMKKNHTFYSCPICKKLIENSKRYKNILIQQQCNLFSIRSTYERGGQAHLLDDLTIDEQLPKETSLVEAPNKKFDLAKQQIILELHNSNNGVNNKILQSKIEYYNAIVNLYQTSINSPVASKSDNLKLIKDYINKLLVMHRVLNCDSSQRQLNDFHCELQRTAILVHVLDLEITINSPSHVITCFILKQLLDQKPFNDEIMSKIISCMKDVDRMIIDKTPFQSIICSLPILPQLLSMNNTKWEQCALKFWHFKSFGKCTVCLP